MDNVYRSTWRTQLTKLCKPVVDYLKAYEDRRYADIDDPEQLEADLNVYIHRIQNAHSNLQKADEAIHSAIKQEEFQKECDEIIEYDDRAVSILAKIQHILNTYLRTGGIAKVTSATTNYGNEISGVKLKAIGLKRFDGNFENCLPFWEQFKQAVHDNHKLTTAAKFFFRANR